MKHFLKSILFFIFALSFSLSAKTTLAQKAKESPAFDADKAKAFFNSSPDLKEESKKYAENSLKFYAEDNLKFAGLSYYISEYFAHLDKYGKDFPTELKIFLLSNPDLLEDFFSTLSTKDNLPKVFEILQKLHKSDAETFKKYPRLAMAIAVVFDAPVPKNFPHAQVSEELLPRKLPEPEKAFATWKSLRERGRMLLKPENMSIEEMKYLVASLASEEDREWAQRSISANLSNMHKLYSSIKYNHSRLERKAFDWEESDYRLKTIKKKGGICVDQAYFTVEAAKSRGVPAFIFSGAGADGFHAWVAYMQKSGSWNFDVGRYAGARFVTGRTLDPQTWEQASDHSLNSMREGFRNGAKYRANEIHTLFARRSLESGKYAKAEKSAKAAITIDRRNLESWEILIKASTKRGATETELISLRENAMKAFFKYPDIYARFANELIAYYKRNNNENATQKLSNAIIQKTKSERPDIAMSFAIAELEDYIKASDTDKLCIFYKRILNTFKSDAAICCNNLTIPTLNALLRAKKIAETEDIMKITRQVLKGAKDASLTSALDSIDAQLEVIRAKMQK